MQLMRLSILTLVGVIGSGCSVFGYRSEEQPNYRVLVKSENKEIRKYEPYIIAKTKVQGSFEEAQSKGFKILAGYIFSKNKSQEKIEMTSPVIQKSEASSEKISMTAPVVLAPEGLEQEGEATSWTMTFSMPSKYSMTTLPQPEDERISIEQVPTRFVAALVFSGFWGVAKNQKKTEELRQWLDQVKKYEVASEAMFAGYNPPWTIPFFRRNEMLIEVEEVQ